jgi:hypothetical protein
MWRAARSKPGGRANLSRRFPSVPTVRLRLLFPILLVLAALAPAPAHAYGWPVRPFNKQHSIRANFGDPRTTFALAWNADPWNGPGAFSFHNGVDIAAPANTAVYPVANGIAHLSLSEGDLVTVDGEAADGSRRSFQYYHLRPNVREADTVVARKTVLGWVLPSALHVHLSEIDGFRITNPLLKGHLTPYRDRNRPRVSAIELRNEKGALVGPLAVCGRVAIAAEVHDTPPLAVPAPWNGLPVGPALVTWKLAKLDGAPLIPTTYAADFRTTLPVNSEFWTIYAKGTYQNAPRFGIQQFMRMPGRFLFSLNPDLDTRTLPNGVYVLTVIGKDSRGNGGAATERISVLNRGSGSGCPPEPPPPPAKKP